MVQTIRESIIATYNGASDEEIERAHRKRNAKFRKDGVEIRYSKVSTEHKVMQFWKNGDPICDVCYIDSWTIVTADYYRIVKIIDFVESDGEIQPPFLEDKYYCVSCLKDEDASERNTEEDEGTKVLVIRLELLSDLNG